MRTRSVTVVVTARQGQVLEAVTRTKLAAQQLVERCRIVLMSAKGRENQDQAVVSRSAPKESGQAGGREGSTAERSNRSVGPRAKAGRGRPAGPRRSDGVVAKRQREKNLAGHAPPLYGPRMVCSMRSKDISDDARLFLCRRCAALVQVCRSCDRGQSYCSTACRRAARTDSVRAARKRYDASPAGRAHHADRQRAYRSRLAPPPIPAPASARTEGARAPAEDAKPVPRCEPRCSMCRRALSGFLRQEFLTMIRHRWQRPGARPSSSTGFLREKQTRMARPVQRPPL